MILRDQNLVLKEKTSSSLCVVEPIQLFGKSLLDKEYVQQEIQELVGAHDVKLELDAYTTYTPSMDHEMAKFHQVKKLIQ